MPKSKSKIMRESRQRYREAGLKKLEVWVPNNPESIAEAKALDKRSTVKQGEREE